MIDLETLAALPGINDFDKTILSYFNCDTEKDITANYSNYCFQTLNAYLSLFDFFHQAIMVDTEPSANPEGMYAGSNKHRHAEMKRYIAEVFMMEQSLDADPVDSVTEAIRFYRSLEALMRSMFGGRIETRDLLGVESYGERINTLRRSTNSARIRAAGNNPLMDRAYKIYTNWTTHYDTVLEESDYF